MRPLTEVCHKALLTAAGKPLIEHILKRIPDEVDEFVFVVGYLGDTFLEYCGNRFLGRPVHYVRQEKPTGTYRALECVREFLKDGEQFIVIYADDLHGGAGIRKLLDYPRAMLVGEVEDPRPYGVVNVNEHNRVIDIIEKPQDPQSNLVSSGAWLLDTDIFKYPPEIHKNGEYYIPDAVRRMLDTHPMYVVQSSFWMPVTCPQDLEKANRFLLSEEAERRMA